jgi:hypothetical protein
MKIYEKCQHRKSGTKTGITLTPFSLSGFRFFHTLPTVKKKKKRQTKSGLTLCQRQKFVAKHSHKKYSGVREYKGRYARILSTVKICCNLQFSCDYKFERKSPLRLSYEDNGRNARNAN